MSTTPPTSHSAAPDVAPLHSILGPFYDTPKSVALKQAVTQLEAQDVVLRDLHNPTCCSRYHFADQLGLPLTGTRPITQDEIKARTQLCDLMHGDNAGLEIYDYNKNESPYKIAQISRGDYCNRFHIEKARKANLFFNFETPTLGKLRQAYPGVGTPDYDSG